MCGGRDKLGSPHWKGAEPGPRAGSTAATVVQPNGLAFSTLPAGMDRTRIFRYHAAVAGGEERGEDQEVRSCQVAGRRDVPDHSDAKQSLDVRIVGMGASGSQRNSRASSSPSAILTNDLRCCNCAPLAAGLLGLGPESSLGTAATEAVLLPIGLASSGRAITCTRSPSLQRPTDSSISARTQTDSFAVRRTLAIPTIPGLPDVVSSRGRGHPS